MNLVLLLGQLGLTLGLPARAALPDRHALRPVRDARARGDRLLDLLRARASSSPGTPSGISLSREGGAHQSIIDAGDRDRDAGADVCRAVLRARARVAAARRARAACRRRTARRSTSASRRRRSTRRPSPRSSSGVGEERLRADVVAGGFRLREPRRRRRPRDARRPAARSCPRRSRPRAARRGGGRRGDRALPLLARPALPRLAGRARRARCDGELDRASHLERLLAPDERGLPVVTVIDGASHALAFARRRARRPLRPARRRPLRPDGQPARGLRRVRHRRGVDRDRRARRARARRLTGLRYQSPTLPSE